MEDILAEHGINLQAIKSSTSAVYTLKASDTFGVVEEPMFTHMVENSTLSYVDLELIINKTLQLFHLSEPILSLFNPHHEQIKLQQIIQKLLRGQYYKKLQEQNPIWLLTNRQTQINIKIILASAILRTMKKLTFQEIKETILVFTLEQNKDRSQGIPLTPSKIIQVLRGINRTISIGFLEAWIRGNRFDVEGWMLPHEFLYLICYCSDRSAYMRLLPRANYKRVKNLESCLYEIQPIREIIGTPDFKIQQKLKEAVSQGSVHKEMYKDKIKEEQKLSKYSKYSKYNKYIKYMKYNEKQHILLTSRQTNNLTQTQKLLRDQNIYKDIRKCLCKNKEKSQKLSNCLTRIKSANTTISRPRTAMHPIKINEIVNSQEEYFDFGFENILMSAREGGGAGKGRTISTSYSRRKGNEGGEAKNQTSFAGGRKSACGGREKGYQRSLFNHSLAQ